MKRILFGAIAALAGGAPLANADTSGVVDLQYRSLDASGADIDGIGYGGSVSTVLSGNWGAQFDARGLRLDAGSAMTTTSGNAHLYHSDGDWKLGALLSIENFSGAGLYGLGVDAQYNFKRASLTGQLVFHDVDSASTNLWTAAVRGRYFFTDNFSAEAHYARTDADGSFLFSDAVDTYGIGAEYKFANQISVFGGYQQANPSSSSADLDRLNIGVRYAFGEGTLLDREKTGPSLIHAAPIAENLY